MIMESWNEKPSDDCDDPAFLELSEDLRKLMTDVLSDLQIGETDINKKPYDFDLRFGLKMYELMLTDKYRMTPRYASDDGVWRYLSIKVVPKIVFLRWGLNPSRFWKEPRRVWLKTLWWYIYLSWQGSREETFEVLKGNTTDEIVQLVERSGPSGYRVELSRKIIERYGRLPDEQKTRSRQLFRRVLKLNTARVKVMEPALLPGGESQYVKELFDYFERQ